MVKLIVFIGIITSSNIDKGGEPLSRIEMRQFTTTETCEAYGQYRTAEENSPSRYGNRAPDYFYYNCLQMQPATGK